MGSFIFSVLYLITPVFPSLFTALPEPDLVLVQVLGQELAQGPDRALVLGLAQGPDRAVAADPWMMVQEALCSDLLRMVSESDQGLA
jgi:hypothetical protein